MGSFCFKVSGTTLYVYCFNLMIYSTRFLPSPTSPPPSSSPPLLKRSYDLPPPSRPTRLVRPLCAEDPSKAEGRRGGRDQVNYRRSCFAFGLRGGWGWGVVEEHGQGECECLLDGYDRKSSSAQSHRKPILFGH